jgi:hypothetical protein
LDRLREYEFLNDNLIEFYIRYLEYSLEQNQPDISAKIYMFNTFFFERLTKGKRPGQINYEAVSKWTNKVNLFQYDFVVVPINESAHWFLAIICNLNCIRRRFAKLEDGVADIESEEDKPRKYDAIKDTEPTRTDSLGADEKPPVSLQMDSNESNDDTRESFRNMTLGETDGGPRRSIPDLDAEKTEADVGENGRKHPTSNSAMKETPADTAVAKASLVENKSSKQPSSGKRGRKAKRKSTGPKYDPETPAIITLDSLISTRSNTIRALKEYLREEAFKKRAMTVNEADLQGINAKGIPSQENLSDCGLYLLAYLEMFLKDPKAFVSKIMQREMNEDEWPKMSGYDFRTRLLKVIQRLHEEQREKKTPSAEEDKTKRDNCEEGFTLLGPMPEPPPILPDVEISSEDEKSRHKRRRSLFDRKIIDRFHGKPKISHVEVSESDPEVEITNHKLANSSNGHQGESDEAGSPDWIRNPLSAQLRAAAKDVGADADDLDALQATAATPPSGLPRMRDFSVDTDYVHDANSSYRNALLPEEDGNGVSIVANPLSKKG